MFTVIADSHIAQRRRPVQVAPTRCGRGCGGGGGAGLKYPK